MKKISFEGFRQAQRASFEKNIPIRNLLRSDGGDISIVDISKVKELYPTRMVNGHKGNYGRLLIIAGSDEFTGAACLCTGSALRSGVGIVTLLTTAKAAMGVCRAYPEAIVHEMHSQNGHIIKCRENIREISKQMKSADAIVIGCGMGNTQGTADLLEYVIKYASCPIIIDADGINALSTRIELLRNAKADILLTPHVGELARLCGVANTYASDYRCELASDIVQKFGVTVLAKSASSVIVSPEGIYLTAWGNDGLAKGGSGDTLAGLCGSFAAQGLKVADSAVLSSSLLGLACEMATKKLPTRSLLAHDVTRILPMLFKKIERLD